MLCFRGNEVPALDSCSSSTAYDVLLHIRLIAGELLNATVSCSPSTGWATGRGSLTKSGSCQAEQSISQMIAPPAALV